jgi:hypothetical protein
VCAAVGCTGGLTGCARLLDRSAILVRAIEPEKAT